MARNYDEDIETVAQLAESQGNQTRADQWRQGADDFRSGKTGYHNWATAVREINES